MAIFKIGMLALTLSILMPVVTGHFKPQDDLKSKPLVSGDSTSVGSTIVHGSILYKTETDFPDFTNKTSLPAKPYPPLPESFPQV